MSIRVSVSSYNNFVLFSQILSRAVFNTCIISTCRLLNYYVGATAFGDLKVPVYKVI